MAAVSPCGATNNLSIQILRTVFNGFKNGISRIWADQKESTKTKTIIDIKFTLMKIQSNFYHRLRQDSFLIQNLLQKYHFSQRSQIR